MARRVALVPLNSFAGRSSRSVLVLAVILFAIAGAIGAEPAPEAIEFFEKEIRPLLVARCHECHGDVDKLKGGLSLASRGGVLAGGETGPAAVPGKPAESLLVEAVRYQGVKMPPNARLPQDEIDKLVRWVELGLPWPESSTPPPSPATPERPFTISDSQRQFWSFQPIVPQAPPEVRDARWPLVPIDRFILAGLESRGVHPNPTADKRTLLRRVTFDLTGLPPTPEELDAFEADASPESFGRVVDRLLASSHYGEQWGRHWLDVVRYADTAGETADYPVPEAYKYRNYVIDAFNADMPYDQFLREQIAGDLLARDGSRADHARRVTATGYLAISRRFGYDPQNYHHLTIADTLDTLGRSVLGLSIGCARCHDHKYDPISMSDYYALYGIFASTQYAFPGSEERRRPYDFVPLLPEAEAAPLAAAHKAELAVVDAEIKRLDGELGEINKSIKAAEDAAAKAADMPPSAEAATMLASLKTRRDALAPQLAAQRAQREKLDLAGPYEVAYGVMEGTPGDAKIQKRGEPTRPGAQVPRHFLEILGGDRLPDAEKGSGRLELAEWLTRSSNPLTARVIVNRVWQFHFGAGLVRGSSDFGLRGRRPSHPELLDYLAAELVRHGWSLKWLHREILLSRAYQLSSSDDNPAIAQDPTNEWHWRFDRRRLDAESIRDAILCLAGTLDTTPGERHPFPPKTSWGYTQHAPFKAVYDTRRRSVYLMTQRIARHPFLALFDGADPNASTAERTLTTTPAQSLFFMNDPFVHEQSQALARRLLAERSEERQRIERACELVLGRRPDAEQLSDAEAFLRQYAQQSAASKAADPLVAAWSAYARVLLASNEFLYID
jgi:hypothetical protein